MKKLKRLVLVSLCLSAFTAVSLAGVSVLQKTFAATTRDCTHNSIDNQPLNGGCGAATPSELIADIRANNPSDLKDIYNFNGLWPQKYDRFATTARTGTAY